MAALHGRPCTHPAAARRDQVTRIDRILVLLCCGLALPGACARLTESAGQGESPGTGARLATRAGVLMPAWSADGSTLYYTTSDPGAASLWAVSLADGSERRLGTMPATNTGGAQVQTATDARLLFFALAAPDLSGPYRIYRMPAAGGVVDTLVTDATFPWFAVSPAGDRLAYPGRGFQWRDTLQVLTLAGASAGARVALKAALANPLVLGFSPDGATLVYCGCSGLAVREAVWAASLDGGAQRRLWQGPAIGSRDSGAMAAPDLLWSAGAPHLLVADWSVGGAAGRAVRISDVDGSTGTRTPVATIAGARSGPWNLARSADGRSFAAWVPMDSVDQWMERTIYRFRLYVQSAGAGPVQRLEWRADEPLYWMKFSPDGRRLAFVLYGRLYIIDVATT